MQDRYVFWCGMGAKRHVEIDVRPQDEYGTAHEDRSRWAGVAAARRVAKARETCVLDQFTEKMRETPENITRVGNSEAQGHCSRVEQDTDNRRQVTRARDRALAKFEMEKARVCCVQEHSTQAQASYSEHKARQFNSRANYSGSV